MTKTMSVLEAINTIQSGKVFFATFRKRTTGEVRDLVGYVKPKRGRKKLKGLAYRPSEYNLVTVFDAVKGDYRSIPVDAILEVNRRVVVPM